MRMSGELNDEQCKQLTMVQKSAHHLLNLINDVLDISKIESGRVDLTIEPIELSELVGEVATALAPIVQGKSLSLEVDALPGRPSRATGAGSSRCS